MVPPAPSCMDELAKLHATHFHVLWVGCPAAPACVCAAMAFTTLPARDGGQHHRHHKQQRMVVQMPGELRARGQLCSHTRTHWRLDLHATSTHGLLADTHVTAAVLCPALWRSVRAGVRQRAALCAEHVTRRSDRQ